MTVDVPATESDGGGVSRNNPIFQMTPNEATSRATSATLSKINQTRVDRDIEKPRARELVLKTTG
jgi:hypothetical protein